MDRDLRDELLRRMELDQQARNALTPFFGDSDRIDGSDPAVRAASERVTSVDEDNTAWLRAIVDTRGWPTVSLVGVNGQLAAWLLVQHADQDSAFQRRCLDLMNAAPPGEVNAQNIAYLTDRVNLAHGDEQVYGTQVHLHDGRWEPRNLAEPATVDDRRRAVGLVPLAEYLASFENPNR